MEIIILCNQLILGPVMECQTADCQLQNWPKVKLYVLFVVPVIKSHPG